MKLLADENIDKRLIRWLGQLSHEISVADKGLKNSKLFALANTEQKILLTNDTDFLSIAMYPTKGTAGRIVLRVFPQTFANQKESLTKILNQLTEDNCKDKLVIIGRDGFEIFPLLEETKFN